MTTTLPPPVELYVRDGSRFVRADAAMHDTGPLPLLERPSAAELPPPPPAPVVPAFPGKVPASAVGISYDDGANRTTIPASRCRHGSFTRYALTHCCKREGIAR